MEFHFHAAVNAWNDTELAQLLHCVIHGFAVLDTEGKYFPGGRFGRQAAL